MTYVSAACLFAVAAICFAGLVSKHYRDNWLQFLGLAGLMWWAVPRGIEMLARDHVGNYQLLSHVSLLCFALGTALKVWRHR